MLAKFVPSGTHIKNGYLEVRIDLFPDNTRGTYAIHYIDRPTIPPEGIPEGLEGEEYETWINGLPTHKELNPCLCHCLKVSEDTTKLELQSIIQGIFDEATVGTIDEGLVEGVGTLEWEDFVLLMDTSGKRGGGQALSPPYDEGEIIAAINTRFNGLEVEVAD